MSEQPPPSLAASAPAKVGSAVVLPAFLLDYAFWAAALNVGGMAGYVAADFLRGYLSDHSAAANALFLGLACVFLADSLLYRLSWRGADPPPSAAALLGERLNIFGSAGYVVTAILVYVGWGFLAVAINVGLILVFLADAIVYSFAWYDAIAVAQGCAPLALGAVCAAPAQPAAPLVRDATAAVPSGSAPGESGCTTTPPVPRPTLWSLACNADLYGNAFNVLAAAIYLAGACAGCALLFASTTWADASYSLSVTSRVNLAGDVVWLVDALFYAASWHRDFFAPDNSEEEGVLAVRVVAAVHGAAR